MELHIEGMAGRKLCMCSTNKEKVLEVRQPPCRCSTHVLFPQGMSTLLMHAQVAVI